MSAAIVLLTGNHLCHNPRALKEAKSLAREGYRVSLLGAWTSTELKRRDEALLTGLAFDYIPVVDTTVSTARARFLRLARRALGKAATAVHRALGIESRILLGQSAGGLLRSARRTKTDLFIAHSEAGLWVGGALGDRGGRVAVDFEDWFSEDLLPEARRARPAQLLRRLERDLLESAAYTSCPSKAMSRALAAEHTCLPPTVIYNAFPWKDREDLDDSMKDRRMHQLPSIHWYSQTLGAGRGLEDLVASLEWVQRAAELHLRGVPAAGFEAWLRSRTPYRWRDRVFVHSLVPNEELLSRIAEHDIGFAGERTDIRSRDLTVTNKILHYLLGGLAVVASDTAGQREVAELAPGAVHLYPAGDPRALAARLNELLDSPALLASSKAAALQAAESTLCWEKQEPRLIAAVERALAGARR